MAAKGVAFTEANRPEFRTYARKIVENSKALAQACMDIGMEVVTGGTDNHLFLVDVTPFGITGRQGASALGECSITLNKNAIPFDKQSPMITSGMRIGTAAVTTLGMGADEMKEIAAVIKLVLEGTGPGTIESGPRAGQPSKIKYQVEDRVKGEAVSRVKTLLDRFPVYPGIDLEFLQEQFEA
jgi:glycine hydroxymethyltransferase